MLKDRNSPLIHSISKNTLAIFKNPLALAFIFSTSLLGGAYAFQYIGGLEPCDLCWTQRYAHMAIIAISLFGLIITKSNPALKSPFIWLSFLGLVASSAIAGFHTGVEQKWWQGPSTCTSGDDFATSVDQLMENMFENAVILCDQIAWQMFGISMAGYNFLLSTLMAVILLRAALKGFK